MKFQINIYKPSRRPKVKIPREPSPNRAPLFMFLGSIVLILLAFTYLYSTEVATLKRKARADRRQIMMLQQFLEETKEGKNSRSGTRALLQEIQRKRVLWKDKLVELSRLVPEEIRLTRVSMKEIEKTPDKKKPRQKVKETVLTMKGEILATPGEESLDHIARLIMRLNESPAFKTSFEPLTLVYTQRMKTKKREFMEFELRGRLRSPSGKG